MSSDRTTLLLLVNGEAQTVTIRNDETLLETLRNQLGITSVRSTCNIGICGACTVLVDDRLVSACLQLTALCDGLEITTSEGLLAADGTLDPVQEAFVQASAFQCSYCTPAMVLTARRLLDEQPAPTRSEIREYLAGNLCRCGSHPQVIEAIESLVQTSPKGTP
jgi:aerobic-type carbon monoxide dehydrogenase small subunit (CoxS/CutS family)